MNATVNVLLFKSKTLSNGNHPLMVRICKDGKKKYKSLGISVHPDYWDFKKNKPKVNCPNKELILKIILDKELEYQKQILEFKSEDKEFTASSPITAKNKPKNKTVKDFYRDVIEEFKLSNKIGNAKVYNDSYTSLSKFTKYKDCSRVSPVSKSKISKILITLKTSGHYAMLASNFDLEAHLREYPPLEYGFDETKYNLRFDPDKIVYVLGLLSSIPAIYKDLIREDGFVPINARRLNEKMTDYRFYLDYLELTGVIEVTLITCQKFIQEAINGLKNIILSPKYIITEKHLIRKAT